MLSNFSFVREIFALEIPIVIFAAKIFERKSFFLRGSLFRTVVVAIASNVDRVTLHFGGRTVALSCEIRIGRRRKISYWAPVNNSVESEENAGRVGVITVVIFSAVAESRKIKIRDRFISVGASLVSVLLNDVIDHFCVKSVARITFRIFRIPVKSNIFVCLLAVRVFRVQGVEFWFFEIDRSLHNLDRGGKEPGQKGEIRNVEKANFSPGSSSTPEELSCLGVIKFHS